MGIGVVGAVGDLVGGAGSIGKLEGAGDEGEAGGQRIGDGSKEQAGVGCAVVGKGAAIGHLVAHLHAGSVRMGEVLETLCQGEIVLFGVGR